MIIYKICVSKLKGYPIQIKHEKCSSKFKKSLEMFKHKQCKIKARLVKTSQKQREQQYGTNIVTQYIRTIARTKQHSCSPLLHKQARDRKNEKKYSSSHPGIKNNKSASTDKINGKMLKLLCSKRIDLFHKICDKIWQSGLWITDWTTSIFIPLNKKGSSQKYNYYRTIALISYSTKVLF